MPAELKEVMEKDFWLAIKDFQTNHSGAQEEKAGGGST